MATILVVEDEKNIQLLIKAQLKPYYTVMTADNGEEALTIIESQHIDLLIADIMMPKMDGIELLKELRYVGFSFPVMLLTAKQTIRDKREGFKIGADDYLTKPVNYEELILRVDALLRRAHISTEQKIVIRDITVDSKTYTISNKDTSLSLPKKEFELLFKLLSYPDQIFTRNQLLDEIWGYDSESSEDTIKTHMNRLRNKCKSFEGFQLLTVKGLGYKAVVVKETGNAD